MHASDGGDNERIKYQMVTAVCSILNSKQQQNKHRRHVRVVSQLFFLFRQFPKPPPPPLNLELSGKHVKSHIKCTQHMYSCFLNTIFFLFFLAPRTVKWNDFNRTLQTSHYTRTILTPVLESLLSPLSPPSPCSLHCCCWFVLRWIILAFFSI